MSKSKANLAMSMLQSAKWAITPEALSGLIAGANRELSEEDRPVFHKAEMKKAMDEFGDQIEGSNYSFIKGNTGFLSVDGPIIPKATMFSEISGLTSIDILSSEFKALEDNSEVENIVLIMDTPGGVITGISEFASLVKASPKKTIGYVFGMAASAGYWIVSAADEIVIADTGEVGSIGTVASIRDTSVRDEKSGVRTIEIVSSQSPNKRPDLTTEEGKGQIQTILDDLADVFISTVAENRGVTTEKVISDFGGGGIRIGKKALELGMADRVATLEELLNDTESSANFYGNTTLKMEGSSMELEKATAEDIQKLNPEAFATIVKQSKEQELARIRAIETLAENVEGAAESVTIAAQGAISLAKKDPSMTADKAAMAVLKATGKAQAEVAASVATGARELGAQAEVIENPAPAGNGKEEMEAAEKAERAKSFADAFKNAPVTV